MLNCLWVVVNVLFTGEALTQGIVRIELPIMVFQSDKMVIRLLCVPSAFSPGNARMNRLVGRTDFGGTCNQS